MDDEGLAGGAGVTEEPRTTPENTIAAYCRFVYRQYLFLGVPGLFRQFQYSEGPLKNEDKNDRTDN